MTVISPSIGGQELTSSSRGGTFTAPAIDATYYQVLNSANNANSFLIADPTADGVLKGRIFLNAMLAGDTVNISVETESADGSWRVVIYSFTGAQTNQQYLDVSARYYNGLGARVRLNQSAGTARSFIYRFFTGTEE